MPSDTSARPVAVRRARECIAHGLFAVALLAGCQYPLQHRDWTTYDGPGREAFLAEEVEFLVTDDPLEPANRAVSAFNHVLLLGIVAPISFAYRSLLAEWVRDGIENAFDNLEYPLRLVNHLFQGKLGGAWNETRRFAINSTVGLLGFRDVASDWGIEPREEDFGQTFGRWGWDDSTYLVIPVLGPSTIRDGFAEVPDGFADPLFYAWPAPPARTMTRLANALPLYMSLVETTFDPYTLGRRLYVLNRELQVDDYEYSAGVDDGGEVETLSAVFLGPQDPDFVRRRVTHEVELPGAAGTVTYSAWLQPEPRPLVYFLPGTGGHRLGGSSLAVAEGAFRVGGSSVVTISSSLNAEFIAGGASAHYPGYVPSDSLDAHVALTAIDADLRERYPGRLTGERRLVGLSLGGLHTLFIAAREAEADHGLLDFDSYLALNAPVDMRHAAESLDAFYNAPLVFPPERRKHEITGILRKVAFMAGRLDPEEPIPVSRLEARFLIGLSFRQILGDVIYQTTLAHPRGVLRTKRSPSRRSAAFQEISRYGFMEYLYAWALPYHAERIDGIEFTEGGAERLFERCGLRSIEGALRDRDDVLFVSARNDFLLRPEDIAWAERVFGERALFFERGGHIGNLHREDIQAIIRERFLDLAPERP